MCRHGTHRGNPPGERSPEDDEGEGLESEPATDTAAGSDQFTDDQHREWRRWIVETFLGANYGVVPVDHLVDRICEREPKDIDRSTVRTALTETVLPRLDRESILNYDVDRELLINYGD